MNEEHIVSVTEAGDYVVPNETMEELLSLLDTLGGVVSECASGARSQQLWLTGWLLFRSLVASIPTVAGWGTTTHQTKSDSSSNATTGRPHSFVFAQQKAKGGQWDRFLAGNVLAEKSNFAVAGCNVTRLPT